MLIKIFEPEAPAAAGAAALAIGAVLDDDVDTESNEGLAIAGEDPVARSDHELPQLFRERDAHLGDARIDGARALIGAAEQLTLFFAREREGWGLHIIAGPIGRLF